MLIDFILPLAAGPKLPIEVTTLAAPIPAVRLPHHANSSTLAGKHSVMHPSQATSRRAIVCKAVSPSASHHPDSNSSSAQRRPLLLTVATSVAALVASAASPALPKASADDTTAGIAEGLLRPPPLDLQRIGVNIAGGKTYAFTIKEIVVNRVTKDGFFGGDAEWRLHGKFGNRDLGDFNFDPEGNTSRRQLFPQSFTFNVSSDELPQELVFTGYEDDDSGAADPLPTARDTFDKVIDPGVYTISAPGNSEGQYDVVVEVAYAGARM
jgi:hypothetical protein